jgi:hypothetical protein
MVSVVVIELSGFAGRRSKRFAAPSERITLLEAHFGRREKVVCAGFKPM